MHVTLFKDQKLSMMPISMHTHFFKGSARARPQSCSNVLDDVSVLWLDSKRRVFSVT